MSRFSLAVILCLFSITSFSQNPIEVAANTVKVPASDEVVFYYGFAEGDQLVFDFEEVNGKELKELEIMAMPSSSLFLDYKTKKIQNKALSIPETGIYKFRFTNSNLLSGRICKFKIQRIPATEATRKFNSVVYKKTLYDTSFNDVMENYIVKADTIATDIVTQNAKVHSSSNSNGNKTITNFVLPANTISWSYYIGVDQKGQDAYVDASQQLSSNKRMLRNLVGSDPLIALALNLPSFLKVIQGGEDIDYYLIPSEYSNLLMSGQSFKCFKQGKVINDFARMDPIRGNLSFCFANDNALTGVSVLLRVTAIQVKAIWATRKVKKILVTPREELFLKS